MVISLLVTGVVGAVAAMLLAPVFGYSSNAGYHLGSGSLTTKQNATLLKLGKIVVAGAVAAYLSPLILAASPVLIGLAVIGGVVVVLHSDIPHWKVF
ncbi:hypothetical protein [Haloferax volcanii]|uniref:hypothetical protein n=1 Tax=Haloferax volcanii TaxID=2246 RepID=UPI003853C180